MQLGGGGDVVGRELRRTAAGACVGGGGRALSTADEHEASLIYIIGRLDQGIRRAMRARLSAWKLSVQEYTTLSVLAARPGLSNAQLARRALVQPQSMIEILAKLENRGHVARRTDPGDDRVLRAELTERGIDVLREAEPVVHALQGEMFAGVPAREQEAAARAMLRAMESLARLPEA